MIELNRYEIALLDSLVTQRLRVIPSEIHHTSVHGFREDLEREFDQLEVLAKKLAQESKLWGPAVANTPGLPHHGEDNAVWGC